MRLKKSSIRCKQTEWPCFRCVYVFIKRQQNDYDKLKEEMLKEFEKGQLNREEAIKELDNRRRLPEESSQTYAHKMKEPVKLVLQKRYENCSQMIISTALTILGNERNTNKIFAIIFPTTR